MAVVINGTTGITSVNGSASAPSVTGTDTDTGIVYGTNTLSLATGGTTAVTVDSSQNVGIGTSSPAYKLDVSTSSADATQISKGASDGYFTQYKEGTTLVGYIYSSTGSSNPLRIGAGNPKPLTLETSGLERMRIDSSGRIFAGTSSTVTPDNPKRMQLAGATVPVDSGAGAQTLTLVSTDTASPTDKGGAIGLGGYSTTAAQPVIFGAIAGRYEGTGNRGYLQFATLDNGGTMAERARIDSSGNLLVGTSNASATVGAGTKLISSGAIYTVMSASTNAEGTLQVYSTGAGAFRFYVGLGGTVYATSTTITGISDQRVKENIRDLDDGLEKIMALQPRKFDWKEGKGKGIANDRGFIAQEFEQVFPDMIEEWKDPAPEGEEPYKAVNANLIPTLVKAIQEQQAIIEQLRADVAQLKGQA